MKDDYITACQRVYGSNFWLILFKIKLFLNKNVPMNRDMFCCCQCHRNRSISVVITGGSN